MRPTAAEVSELHDLFGGTVSGGPPPVPPVVFHEAPHRRRIRLERQVRCGHCQMVARHVHDGGPVGCWRTAADIMILNAVYLITQTDGSTLELCEQHAREHEERGNR